MRYSNIIKVILIALISSSAACSDESPTIKKDNIVTLSRDPVVTFLGSQNKNIIDLNDSDMEMLNLDLLDYVEKDDGFPVSIGVWVVAPEEMNKENNSILTAYLLTGLRSWEVNLQANTFLLLRHWESGSVWTNTPYLNVRRGQVAPKSGKGEKPSELVAAGWSRSVNKINILDSFPGFLSHGHYTITKIYYDKKSNSESFTYTSGEPILVSVLPKTLDVSVKGSSVNVDFDKTGSDRSIWNLNVIALKLDGDPIIVPFSVDLNKQEKNLSFTLPAEKDGWEKGAYKIYVDGGADVVGPFDFNF